MITELLRCINPIALLYDLKKALPYLPLIPIVVLYLFNLQTELKLLIKRDTWDNEYDYIVIGAGSSGSVMAARLSEDPNVKVLLLEAGGSENFVSQIPLMAFFLQKTPMDWAFVTEPQ